MSAERCDNYDVCEKYATYGKCENDSDGPISLTSYCGAYEKQIIKILSSIDEKLDLLLEQKSGTE